MLFYSSLFFFITLIALVLATFTDVKDRLIPNWLTLGMIAAGLLLHSFIALASLHALSFLLPLAITLATFLASFALWKLGVWAGGDVKLFTGIAALNPFNLAFFPHALSYDGLFTVTLIPFPLTLFIFSLFSMLPYGAFLSLQGLRKSRKLRREFSLALQSSLTSLLFFSSFIIGFEVLLSSLAVPWFFIVPFALAFGLLPARLRLARLALALVMLATGLALSAFTFLEHFLLLFLPLAFLYALVKLYAVSREHVLQSVVKVSSLKEGDILGESIIREGSSLRRVPRLSFSTMIKYLKSNNLKGLFQRARLGGKVIASSASAAGITSAQVKALKVFVSQGKLRNAIIIKKSVPFTPAILLAYVILSFMGDAIWVHLS